MRAWCIYFDDETAFSSDDGAWEDAPVDGVLFVAQRDGERVNKFSGSDVYVMFEDGTIAAPDELGPLIRRRPPILTSAIKFGRTCSHRLLERVRRRMTAEWGD